MSKSATTSNFSDLFADVDLQPVHVAGKEVNKIAVRVKDDSRNFIFSGILGKEYNLIKNSIARDISHDIQSRSGKSWKSLKNFWDGKKYIDYTYSEDPVFELKNGTTYPIHHNWDFIYEKKRGREVILPFMKQ